MLSCVVRPLCLRTPEPHRPGVAVLVEHGVLLPGCVHVVVQHPHGGHEDQDDEEHLQVGRAEDCAVEGGGGDQRYTQDHQVQEHHPRQQPAPVPRAVPGRGAMAAAAAVGRVQCQLGFTYALLHVLAWRAKAAVGQTVLLYLFVRHPAGVTGQRSGEVTGEVGGSVSHTRVPCFTVISLSRPRW